MEWIKANLWEIKQSSSLRHLGAILSFIHVLTFAYWLIEKVGIFSGTPTAPICWGFMQNCTASSSLPPSQWQAMLITYGVFSGMAVLCFLADRMVSMGWFLLIVSLAFKTFFYVQDMALVENIHTTLLFLNLVFLFFPQKRRLSVLIIVFSYIAMGASKLNPDWMAGYWLSHQFPDWPIKSLEWLAAMVVVIELIAPLFLLINSWKSVLFTVLGLSIFHVGTYFTLGYFQPAVSILLLFFTISSYAEKDRLEREAIYQSFMRPEPSRLWVPLGILLFWAIQSVGRFSPNPNLKTNPLTFSSFSIPMECEQSTFLVGEHNAIHTLPFFQLNTEGKACLPSARFNTAKKSCDSSVDEMVIAKVATYYQSRKISQTDWSASIASGDICDKSLTDVLKGGQ